MATVKSVFPCVEVTDTVEIVIDVFVSEPDVTVTGQVVTVTYVMTVFTVGGKVFWTGADPEEPPFDPDPSGAGVDPEGPPFDPDPDPSGAGVADVSLSGGVLEAPVGEETASDDDVELPALEEEEESCGHERS